MHTLVRRPLWLCSHVRQFRSPTNRETLLLGVYILQSGTRSQNSRPFWDTLGKLQFPGKQPLCQLSAQLTSILAQYNWQANNTDSASLNPRDPDDQFVEILRIIPFAFGTTSRQRYINYRARRTPDWFPRWPCALTCKSSQLSVFMSTGNPYLATRIITESV